VGYMDSLNAGFGGDYTPPEPPKNPPINFTPGSSSPTDGKFRDRGFPEAMQVDQVVPGQVTGEIGGVAGALDTAFRGPAYIAERPLALVDELTKGFVEGGAINYAVEGIRSLPGIGQPLSNIGDATEKAFDFTFSAGNLVASPLNAHKAWLWDSTKDNKESDDIGFWAEWNQVLRDSSFLGQVLNPFDTITKAELRKDFNEKGWTDEDLRDIETGRKGWMDFHEKTLRVGLLPGEGGQAIENFLTRAVGDPLNLVFGTGVMSKAGYVFKGGAKVGAQMAKGAPFSKAVQNVRIANSAKKAAPFMTPKPLPINEGVDAFAKGSIAGVTKNAVAKYIMSRRNSPFKAYRDLAYGTTTAQIALNSVDSMVNGDGETQDGWMGEVFDFARRWGENKPISKNDLFTLYMIMKVPGRTMAAGAVRPLKNKRNTGQFRDLKPGEFAQGGRRLSHENTFAELLYPELVGRVKSGKGKGSKDYGPAKREVERRAGGVPNAQAIYMHLLKTALHKVNFLQGVPSLPDLLHVNSMAAAGKIVDRYSKMMNNMVDRALQEGGINAEAIKAATRGFTATRGGILEDVTRGVQNQNFRTEDFWTSWGQWERLADRTATSFGDGVAVRPGVVTDMVTTDDIQWVLANIDVMKQGKNVSGEQLMDLLNAAPAIFNFPGGENFAKALTRDGVRDTYKVKDVRKCLRKIEKDHAVSRAEYVATYDAWEAVSQGNEVAAFFGNERMAAGKGLAHEVNPELADSAVAIIPTMGKKGMSAAHAEAGGAGVGVIRTIRDSAAGQAFRYNFVAGMKLAGFGVRSSMDSIVLIGNNAGIHGMAAPALLIRLSPNRPVRDVMDMLAMGLERSTANRATAIWRGAKEIKDLGMVTNGTELTYQVGKLTEDGWSQLINKLNDTWGDNVLMNDTMGTVRILVPDAQTRGIGSRLERVDKLLGGKKTADKVAFRDVVRNKTDARSTEFVTLGDQLKLARTSRRYQIASELVDEGVGGYRNASTQRVGRGVRERARAESRAEYPLRSDGLPDYAEPTWWERNNGGGVRGSTTKHRVSGLDDGVTADHWTEHINSAGIRDTATGGERFSLRDGDRVYTTGGADDAAGVIVRHDGEVIPWHIHPGKRLPDNWGEVLAESSREGTWARFATDDTSKLSGVDTLSQHGYVPAARSKVSVGVAGEKLETIVYMVYDPGNMKGLALNGRTWKQAKKGHQSMKTKGPLAARERAMGIATELHPQRVQRMAQAGIDEQILSRTRQITEANAEIGAIQSTMEAAARVPKAMQTDPVTFNRAAAASQAERNLRKGVPGETHLPTAGLDMKTTAQLDQAKMFL